jgi:hypothetical protein
VPKYVVSSDTPIKVRQLERPDLPDIGSPENPWVPGEGGGEYPDTGGPGRWPGFPERPGHGLPPSLPPRDEWPPLPPWLEPGVGLPIPPTIEHPMVPLPEGPDEPTGIWPPIKPELPDLSGKSLALAYVFVSRRVSKLAWVVIDHEEAKEAFQKLKDRLPAGGVAGRPPERPTPGGAPR